MSYSIIYWDACETSIFSSTPPSLLPLSWFVSFPIRHWLEYFRHIFWLLRIYAMRMLKFCLYHYHHFQYRRYRKYDTYTGRILYIITRVIESTYTHHFDKALLVTHGRASHIRALQLSFYYISYTQLRASACIDASLMMILFSYLFRGLLLSFESFCYYSIISAEYIYLPRWYLIFSLFTSHIKLASYPLASALSQCLKHITGPLATAIGRDI